MLSSLTPLVTAGRLFFPPEVIGELERGGAYPDAALQWARAVRSAAERRANLTTVQSVLAIAPDLLDPDIPHEQADPYVVALGLDLSGEGVGLGVEGVSVEITIVTDDRRDKPGIKMSLATAAGMVRLPTVPLFAFLRAEGLTP